MDRFLLANLFHDFQGEDGVVYYRKQVDGDGYIVYWNDDGGDGQDLYLHTYRFPPDVWGV